MARGALSILPLVLVSVTAIPVPTRAALSEAEFHALIDRVVAEWQPMAASHGATLVADRRWSSKTINAVAERKGREWQLILHGEYARQPDTTADTYTLLLCHELGHHFAGYVFKWDLWVASEGQADYFAAHACARRLWEKEKTVNAGFRAKVPAAARSKCDAVWKDAGARDLCYRVAVAALGHAGQMARIKGEAKAPSFDTPDPRRVSESKWEHRNAQCRLDTFLAGALCTREFDVWKIPSADHPAGVQTAQAERDAQPYTCFEQEGFTEGVRPRCWFKSFVTP